VKRAMTHGGGQRVIVTRPGADAAVVAAKLADLGHVAITFPLLEIVRRDNIVVPHRAYQAICVTSANGALHFPLLQSIPVVCVGPQSAAAARAQGYANVSHSGGDVDGLVKHIASTRDPVNGPVLYLSGSTTSGDLEGKLTGLGFDVDRVMVYDAKAKAPEGLEEAVKDADSVLLYSPRSAALWVEAVEKAGLAHHVQKLMHICLSSNVSSKLPPAWPRRLAQAPNEPALFAALAPPHEQE
jgi:uroporphyrinogen-III synthase